jgi:hypothetical protein
MFAFRKVPNTVYPAPPPGQYLDYVVSGDDAFSWLGNVFYERARLVGAHYFERLGESVRVVLVGFSEVMLFG